MLGKFGEVLKEKFRAHQAQAYKLCLGTLYTSHIDTVHDQCSINELDLLKLDDTTSDTKIWLVGDFNAHAATHSCLINLMLEHVLE